MAVALFLGASLQYMHQVCSAAPSLARPRSKRLYATHLMPTVEIHRLMRFLSRLFQRPPPPFTAALKVAEPVALIGDIHGCDRLLDRLLGKLDSLPNPLRIVCVGDYIDRGDGSAAVIDTLMQRPDIVCLKGNHEAMCLGFLDDPEKYGRRWLRYGGLQTLAGYGVAGPVQGGDRGLQRVRDDLALAMGDARIDWLRGLPLTWQTGNLLVTHAGGNPAQAAGDQRSRDLLWGHPDFMTLPRMDGIWVAYGHVIQDKPVMAQGRIALDTGAYATGVLTAAVLGDGPPRFVTA
ncbi:metallophosphoesterase [Loktanella sp. R86503]|uniref:metallophosphoesterase n=1 Tax=Loktanella sp. R86503 TaxID=3093847 RepID=UPI0036D78B3C